MHLVDTLIGTLTEGPLLILSAIGIVLIFKTTRVMNFAHGFIGSLSGYLSYQLVTVAGLPFVVGVVVGIIVGGIAGLLCGLVMGRLAGRPPLELVIATFGIGYLLQWFIEEIWGHTELAVARPLNNSNVSIGGIEVSMYAILVTVFSLLMVLGLALLINRTDLGLKIRMTFDDPVAARLLGIKITTVRYASWTVGGALGGAAGVLLAPILYLSPERMLLILLLAFSAAVIGGFTSLYGTILGGLMVSFVKQASAAYVSVEFSNLILYGFIVVFLCLRPFGLFGSAADEDHASVEGETPWRPLARLTDRITARTSSGGWTDGVRHLVTPLIFLAVVPLMVGFDDLTALSFMILFITVLGVAVGTYYAGQISMGQIAFMAIGMFVAAHIVERDERLWWLAILSGFFVSLVVAFAIAWPVGRLRGAYFAVLTLAVGLATPEIIYKWSSVTGGGMGMVVTKPFELDGPSWYYVVAGIATACYLGVIALRNSNLGRAVVAVRDDSDAAQALGIRPELARMGVFTLTGSLGGLAGALYALNIGFVGPEIFGLHQSILFFVAAVVAKSITGSVWGTALITWVPIWLAGSSTSNAVYGLVLLIVVFLIPGDFSGLDKIRKRRRKNHVFVQASAPGKDPSSDQKKEEECSVTPRG